MFTNNLLLFFCYVGNNFFVSQGENDVIRIGTKRREFFEYFVAFCDTTIYLFYVDLMKI
jgi:hypothetical protein